MLASFPDSMICFKKCSIPDTCHPFDYFFIIAIISQSLFAYLLPMLCFFYLDESEWIMCIRNTCWFQQNLRHRPGSQVVKPLLVEMFVPKLFKSGLKHALGLTLPALFSHRVWDYWFMSPTSMFYKWQSHCRVFIAVCSSHMSPIWLTCSAKLKK